MSYATDYASEKAVVSQSLSELKEKVSVLEKQVKSLAGTLKGSSTDSKQDADCLKEYVDTMFAFSTISPTQSSVYSTLMQSGRYSACDLVTLIKEQKKQKVAKIGSDSINWEGDLTAALDTPYEGRVKIGILKVDYDNNHPTTVNWHAVIKDFQASASTSENAAAKLQGILGAYGDAQIIKSLDSPVLSGIPLFFNITEDIPYVTKEQHVSTEKTGITETDIINTNYVSVGLKIKILPKIDSDSLKGDIYADMSEIVAMTTVGSITAPDTSSTNTNQLLNIPWGKSLILTGMNSKHSGGVFGDKKKDTISEFVIIVTAVKDDTKTTVSSEQVTSCLEKAAASVDGLKSANVDKANPKSDMAEIVTETTKLNGGTN
jgi:hypothetical protein